MVRVVRRTYTKRFGPWNVENVTSASGAYVLMDRNGSAQYVGCASNLRQRLRQHLDSADIPDTRYFRTYQTNSPQKARTLERKLFRKLKPLHNVVEP